MDKPLGKSSGEITIDVHLNGLDEQLAKAYELVETIEKARSLADDLAKGIKSIELEQVSYMKYLNFRIENQWVKDGKVVDGWFILGQRSTDLNWSLLHEAASFEAAKEFIRGIRERVPTSSSTTRMVIPSIFNPWRCTD